MCEPYERSETSKNEDNEEYHARVYWHAEAIYSEGVECCAKGYGVGDDNTVYSTEDKERNKQGSTHHKDVAQLVYALVATEEPYHHKRGDGEQVEDMHTDRETHEVGDEDYPAHRGGPICILLPLEHEPYHHRRKHRR